MREQLGDAGTAAAQTLEQDLSDEHAVPGGAEWAVGVSARLSDALGA